MTGSQPRKKVRKVKSTRSKKIPGLEMPQVYRMAMLRVGVGVIAEAMKLTRWKWRVGRSINFCG